MKKIFIALLVLGLLLCGCAEAESSKITEPVTDAATELTSEPTTEPTTEATTEPETEPVTEPAPVYRNPLNGSIMDAPFTGRIYGVCINNLPDAVPHANVVNADLYFESFVNGSIIRGFALFTDVSKLDKIGPVRSDRYMFNDLAVRYDAIIAHAGGMGHVLTDATTRGVNHFNIEYWDNINITSFRDKERSRAGYGYEHTLFAVGPGLMEWSETSGFRMNSDPDKVYNLNFREDGTPESGQPANTVDVNITYASEVKNTTMIYDSNLGKYVYNQYRKAMVDDITGEPEAFTNVLILMGDMYMTQGYQRMRFEQGGEGWYACGGKAIPIRWGAENETSTPWFQTMDGEPLMLGQGNTYVALTANGSKVTISE